MVFEPPPILVSGGMIVQDGRVLLGRRAPHRRICPDTWDLIGGHVDPGETVEDALVRELQEEIGVTPILFSPVTVIDFSQEAGRAVRYHLFRIDAVKGEPRLANDEHTALRWFALADAAALSDLASARYRPFLLAQISCGADSRA
jgi:mutator protein MutT